MEQSRQSEIIKSALENVKSMVDFIAYADGKKDLLEISNIIGVPVSHLIPVITKLTEADLLEYSYEI